MSTSPTPNHCDSIGHEVGALLLSFLGKHGRGNPVYGSVCKIFYDKMRKVIHLLRLHHAMLKYPPEVILNYPHDG